MLTIGQPCLRHLVCGRPAARRGVHAARLVEVLYRLALRTSADGHVFRFAFARSVIFLTYYSLVPPSSSLLAPLVGGASGSTSLLAASPPEPSSYSSPPGSPLGWKATKVAGEDSSDWIMSERPSSSPSSPVSSLPSNGAGTSTRGPVSHLYLPSSYTLMSDI